MTRILVGHSTQQWRTAAIATRTASRVEETCSDV